MTDETAKTPQTEPIEYISELDNPNFLNDLDRDGISNEDEVTYGTSPDDFDTDGDGIDDKKEIEEYGTNPINPDTDGDGFWDGVEILNGYNPNGQ